MTKKKKASKVISGPKKKSEKKKVVEEKKSNMKKASIQEAYSKKKSQKSPDPDEKKNEKNIQEKNAREAVRIAQQSTIDLIRASARKFSPEKQTDDLDNEDDFMNVLTPRRRGRPPKHEKSFKKNSPVYEPEFNGLMEEHPQITESNTENSAFHKDNEIIDFWTDDDIPMAKGWKDDIIEF